MHLIACCDGAAVPKNPGHMGAAYVLVDDAGSSIEARGLYLGWGTNNVAEYAGVGFAIRAALAKGATSLDIRTDSQLVANQVRGLWRVNAAHLARCQDRVHELLNELVAWSITWVPRRQNADSDALANQAAKQRRTVEGVLQ